MLLKPFGKYLLKNLMPIVASRWSNCSSSGDCSSPSKCGKGSKSKSKGKDKGKGRQERSCKRSPKKKCCSKVPTPFPSYSECKRKPTDPKPSKECDCWDFDKC